MAGVRISVHVTPKAARDEVVGWRGGELAVRVTSAPEDNKANAALCSVLAGALGVSKSSVRVMRGAASRHKIVEIDNVTPSDVSDTFGEPYSTLF